MTPDCPNITVSLWHACKCRETVNAESRVLKLQVHPSKSHLSLTIHEDSSYQPGSTSTKIAVYENETPLLIRNIKHTTEELAAFPRIIDQFEFRKNLVLKALESEKIPFDFDAIIGRGGLLKPIPGGVYEVNDVMLDDIIHAMRNHACNLGCLIASELSLLLPGCRAFIADPGVVDELEDVARITGSPLMPKITIWHALNQRPSPDASPKNSAQSMKI